MPINRKEYAEKYYNTNRERILEIMKIRANCNVCGKLVSRSHMNEHKKSLKCLKSLKQ